jgi:hypothetical protein
MIHKFPVKNEALINTEIANVSSVSKGLYSITQFCENISRDLNITGQDLNEELDSSQSQFYTFQFEAYLKNLKLKKELWLIK